VLSEGIDALAESVAFDLSSSSEMPLSIRSSLDNNGNDNGNDGDDEKGMVLCSIPAIVRSPLWILLCLVMQSSVR
jgi:hypothetical protein